MPHFVIDCSENILNLQQPEKVTLEVHKTAANTGLFDEPDIKVRLNPFKENYLVGGKQGDFIHVFANIMEGRTTEQKAKLSKQIVNKLNTMFPSIEFIAININDFEKATYCNKNML
ncbi:5-carboxymethyl-2-hydroxymuconate Delta-isomerase [Algibacter sp. PT7-4]|uniref:5-carboxymethyl-2-hydroxymuconate Delta-isomerase n=1 Tax=Algibacter ulvanivorans TaxID=3400999 RepID=UPI003AAE1B00